MCRTRTSSIATWWETAEWVAKLSPSKGAKMYFVQGHEIFPGLPLERCRATYRLPLRKIVVAEWLRRTMATEYGDTDVDLVPNSVDHEQFHAVPRGKQARPTIGFLYSPVGIKGVDVALRAIELIHRRVPDLHVVSFGLTVLPPSLSTGIDFQHDPPQMALRDIYASCDVWLTASRSEGFNLPAMEAMACRTPVVSTRTGWPEESIVDGLNGYLSTSMMPPPLPKPRAACSGCQTSDGVPSRTPRSRRCVTVRGRALPTCSSTP